MAEEGHLPPWNNGWMETSAPMEHGTPSEILPVEMMVDDVPLFPSLFIFTSLSLKFWLFFLCLDKFCYDNFQYAFKPKGAGTFSTALNFMEENSDYAMFYYYYRITTIRERTPQGIKILVHKVDGPNKGKKNSHKSTTWTDPTSDKDSSP